jgi:hypothetical protein
LRAFIGAAFALVLASSTVACGAILGFPDQTNADPNFGSLEGGGPDGSTPLDGSAPDGFVPDGPVPSDSSIPLDAPIVSPDGGCNCFGGTCNGGVCQPVAISIGQIDPNFIDTDDTTVFFASGAGTIFAVDPSNVDAGVRKITDKVEPSINDLRARSGYVYFVNANSGALNTVSRCSGTTGCQLGRLEYGGGGRPDFAVAVDATNVYFTVAAAQGSNGGLWSCKQTGCAGSARFLARDYPGLIVTNGTTVSWLEGGNNNGIERSTTTGGGLTVGSDLAVVDLTYAPNSDVYFVKQGTLSRQIGAQAPTQIIAPQVTDARAVRADASYVYWLNGGLSGAVMRCPLGVPDCTSLTVAVATGLNNPFGMALSTDSIYFTTRNDKTVWRLRK